MNSGRIERLTESLDARRLDAAVICGEANVLALTGVRSDNAILVAEVRRRKPGVVLYTDFRYLPMAHRVAPWLKVKDIRSVRLPGTARRIGFETSVSHARYLTLKGAAERGARFCEIDDELAAIRAAKTSDEIVRLKAAQALNISIWREASAAFRPGMTEREMARIVRLLMAEKGDGEAFDTIVCVGKNAAECHHEPDDTVWNGREGVLVDMGVKSNGVCSDLTRNVPPKRPSRLYRKVYDLVRKAHDEAIAAVRPGIAAKALDAVARGIIRKGGFGKCFGHSLGHGVGLEIHEAPTVSKRGSMILEPGMVFTIEPGIYLEDNLGVRIEDMVLVTDGGCEVL